MGLLSPRGALLAGALAVAACSRDAPPAEDGGSRSESESPDGADAEPLVEVLIRTQADLDAFEPPPPGECFRGILRIDDSEFETLDAFNTIECVEGEIIIARNARLTALRGFGMLRRIDGSLEIGRNLVLTELSGFSALETVTWQLVLAAHPVLERIDGLRALRDVSWLLFTGLLLDEVPSDPGTPPIAHPVLASLDFLGNLEVVGEMHLSGIGSWTPAGTELLSDVDPVEVERLVIGGLPGTRFDSFNRLTTLSVLVMAANGDLVDLGGFAALERIGPADPDDNDRPSVTITGNDHLARITGFENLREVVGPIEVLRNPRLPLCHIEAFAERVGSRLLDDCPDVCDPDFGNCGDCPCDAGGNPLPDGSGP